MTSLSISHYQTGLQVILEKKEGNVYIDNLRAILLMEGNFNIAMKILLGSHMICSVQNLDHIPSKCYGSHPCYMAIQVSLGCTLTTDITRQSWATLVVPRWIVVLVTIVYHILQHPFPVNALVSPLPSLK